MVAKIILRGIQKIHKKKQERTGMDTKEMIFYEE